MASEVLKVTETRVNGLAEIVTSLKVEEIKGNAREKVEIPLIFDLPDKAEIKEAYLDLSVVGITQKWRVYLGDFSLTKEFKPLISSELYGQPISKFIFNVTPTKHVLIQDPTLRIVNNSNESVRVLQASLILFYEYKGLGVGNYFYGVSLKPVEAISGSIDPTRAGYLYTVLYSNSLNNVKLKVGRCAKDLKVDNVSEVELECDKGGGYAIEGEKPLVPLSLVVGSYELSLPKLELDIEKKGNKIVIKLTNSGSKADTVILLAYASGKILERHVLGELKSGENKTLELDVKPERNMVGVGIRAIWVKANLRDFVEKWVPL